jgi:hypothetical protein
MTDSVALMVIIEGKFSVPDLTNEQNKALYYHQLQNLYVLYLDSKKVALQPFECLNSNE